MLPSLLKTCLKKKRKREKKLYKPTTYSVQAQLHSYRKLTVLSYKPPVTHSSQAILGDPLDKSKKD